MKKVLLITGGSRGIGAATALLAARRGYAVAINYLQRQDAAEALAKRIVQQGGQAQIFQADVSQAEQVRELFGLVDKHLGTLSVLINNAGILEPQSKAEAISPERFIHLMQVNALSVLLCSQEATKRMSPRFGGHGGAIVNVSSLAAKTGAPFEYVDYAASKAAVEALTLGLARELSKDHIRVNAVRPAFIHTDIHALGGEAARIERMKERIPMGRGGYPAEVAEAILWLSSEASSYSTGAILDVSGDC